MFELNFAFPLEISSGYVHVGYIDKMHGQISGTQR